MNIVVKLGGTLLDEADSRQRLANEITALAAAGHRVVVVHGGGKQMTRFLAERGIDSTFVNGLRVTTAEVLDAVVKVVAGSVNQQLVASFITAGALAIGLSGVDALLAEAEPMSPELGFVGRTVRSDARLLDLLASNGYLPVVACVAGDRWGQIYNVNADQMAVACAVAFKARMLLFLTDVEGVRGADNRRLPTLTVDECASLISTGVASGGMQAKLNAATDALMRGVQEIVIAPGAMDGVVETAVSGASIGTRMMALSVKERG